MSNNRERKAKEIAKQYLNNVKSVEFDEEENDVIEDFEEEISQVYVEEGEEDFFHEYSIELSIILKNQTTLHMYYCALQELWEIPCDGVVVFKTKQECEVTMPKTCEIAWPTIRECFCALVAECIKPPMNAKICQHLRKITEEKLNIQ